MQYAVFAIQIIIASIILIVGYNLLSKYLFSKIKINKWVVLVIGVVVYFIPPIFTSLGAKLNIYVSYSFSIVFAIILLWFFDLMGWTRNKALYKAKKKDEVIIKPKAKPNRVKNKE